MHSNVNAYTLKHRPPVLPQDAVFQLFKPQLKLAAQPLEVKSRQDTSNYCLIGRVAAINEFESGRFA